jgi:hypothetical protein
MFGEFKDNCPSPKIWSNVLTRSVRTTLNEETATMASVWRFTLIVLAMIMFGVSTAHAFGGRFGMFAAPARTSSYMAMPATYDCWPTPTVLPVPDAYPKYATPTPAPPSSLEPPMGKGDPRLPKIITKSPDVAKERCRVGFWNMAGRDLSVTIEGKAFALRKNQVLTFDMDRQFTWQVAGKTPQIQRVPEGQAAFEVLIRE